MYLLFFAKNITELWPQVCKLGIPVRQNAVRTLSQYCPQNRCCANQEKYFSDESRFPKIVQLKIQRNAYCPFSDEFLHEGQVFFCIFQENYGG